MFIRVVSLGPLYNFASASEITRGIWKVSCYLTTTKYSISGTVCIFSGMLYISMKVKIVDECAFASNQSLLSPTIWWRHQLGTFTMLLALCARNSPVNNKFPSQWPVMQSFDSFSFCTWTNGWVNKCDAGDLKYHHNHDIMNGVDSVWKVWGLQS